MKKIIKNSAIILAIVLVSSIYANYGTIVGTSVSCYQLIENPNPDQSMGCTINNQSGTIMNCTTAIYCEYDTPGNLFCVRGNYGTAVKDCTYTCYVAATNGMPAMTRVRVVSVPFFRSVDITNNDDVVIMF